MNRHGYVIVATGNGGYKEIFYSVEVSPEPSRLGICKGRITALAAQDQGSEEGLSFLHGEWMGFPLREKTKEMKKALAILKRKFN